MTKKEKAIEIIKQGGGCTGVRCNGEEENECPCYYVCGKIDGNNNPHPDKEAACRMFLFRGKERDIDRSETVAPVEPAEKTLLDEFAIAAMQGICANVPLEKFAQDVLDEKYDNERQNNAYVFVAYSYAAAMMAERNRRDEMGNVKEATE